MRKKVFLILIALMSAWQTSFAYDFSAVSPSGHTLYYIYGGIYNGISTVHVIYPGEMSYSPSSTWSGYTKPTGNLVIPSSVTNAGNTYMVVGISSYAFFDCDGLITITIPSGVTSIGGHAFQSCSGIASVSIPNSVRYINECAFDECSSLTSVSIPNSVQSIGASAFGDCSSLTSITIPNSVVNIRDYTFQNCNSLTSVILGDSVTSIGNDAFSYCSSLISIIIPNSVTSIGNSAFYHCSSLTSVTIPDSVTSIGWYAFEYCSGLTSITIGNNITSIGREAFRFCSNLDTVFLKPFTPPTLGPSVFSYNASGRVFILNGCSYDNYYNNSSWNNYRSYLRHPIINFNFTLSVNESTYGFANVIPGPGNRDIRCDSTIVVEATSNYGYHLGQWSTGSTSNPDTITLVGDSVVTAFFLPNQYTLTVNADEHGTVTGNGAYNYLSNRTIAATANHGYHFTNWNDGVTNNPRTIILTQDTSFTAYFDINTYTITVQSSNTDRGSVTGGVTTEYLNTTTISATANYGYHFSHWNDGNTDNPRTVQVTDNATYTAYFDYDQFSLTVQSDNTAQGNVSGGGNYNYLSNRTITATPNYGYHFTQWDDGNTDNPRSITLTQDTAFTAFFENNSYTISVVSNDTVKGIALGSTTTLYLDSITISAAANNGYHFTHWNGGVTDNPRTVQVTGNTTYTAYFDYDQFTLTVQSENTAQGNVSGGGSYNYLSNRTITATPTYGHHFTYWNDGVTENPRTITLTQDTSFVASFERNSYIVTVLSNNETMGSATGGDTVLYLDSVTIHANANYGYHFVQWSDNDTDNPRTFQVTSNKTYTAQFTYNQYTITLNVDTSIHGTCTGDGTYDYLSNRIIRANTNYGYHFTYWQDGDTNNPRTITLTQDTIFTAYYAPNQYSILGQTNDSVTGVVEGSAIVDYLDSVTLEAIPNYGYHFVRWNDNNTDNPRTVQVMANANYTAYFDYDQFILTVQSDNTIQGYVSGGGSYDYLSNRTITATPNYGYHFTYWNDGVVENPRTITLTQDTSFTAHFAPNQYTLTVTAGEHGTATGGGTYDYGDTIVIQAYPEEHYHFTRWNDGNTSNPRQYRIEEDKTLTAFFAIDTHTVSVVPSDIVRGMVESTGTRFIYGTPCTVTATAYTGYTFAGWSNGVTANPYTFAVISDVELTALFVEEGEEVYTVTVESADPTMGTVSGGGQALNGGTVTITAIPNEGYRFLTWNDGNTENPRTVTVMGNITYTAYFESTQGIGDIDATEIKIYSKGGRIVVQGAEGVEARVYDLTGREVVRPNQNGETPVLPSGVYLVKVGILPARKVVVIW